MPAIMAGPAGDWTRAASPGMLRSCPSRRAGSGLQSKEGIMIKSSGRGLTRHVDAAPARASGVVVNGPSLRGPMAIASLAIGAAAIGALAIGRLSIANAHVKRLVIDELEVGRLQVEDLEVTRERRPATPPSV
jgi:hypothetical protein